MLGLLELLYELEGICFLHLAQVGFDQLSFCLVMLGEKVHLELDFALLLQLSDLSYDPFGYAGVDVLVRLSCLVVYEQALGILVDCCLSGLIALALTL